jgi:hypothetical protein
MEVSEELEGTLNTLFVIILAISVVIFWFLIMPIS